MTAYELSKSEKWAVIESEIIELDFVREATDEQIVELMAEFLKEWA